MCPNCPGAGSELDNLGVSGSGQIPLLTCRLVYLLAWIKLPLREEMWLSSLHNHVPAVLVCGHESDGRKPDWLVVRCCNSGDVFAAGLALVPALPLPPIRAPAQEKISSHSEQWDVAPDISAVPLRTTWASSLESTVWCSWQTHWASHQCVLHPSGIAATQGLPANWKQRFLLLQQLFFFNVRVVFVPRSL